MLIQNLVSLLLSHLLSVICLRFDPYIVHQLIIIPDIHCFTFVTVVSFLYSYYNNDVSKRKSIFISWRITILGSSIKSKLLLGGREVIFKNCLPYPLCFLFTRLFSQLLLKSEIIHFVPFFKQRKKAKCNGLNRRNFLQNMYISET